MQGVYGGYYILNPNSICIFDPIDSITMSKIFEKPITFCQTKHNLNPLKYEKFNSILKNKRCVNMDNIINKIALNCTPL